MCSRIYRYISIIAACLALFGSIPCQAMETPQLSASAYILMDARSGRVLLGQNIEQEMSIASTTKIMTALVALEHGDLSDVVTVKASHLKEGSSMYLQAGEQLTLEALLYGLLLPSGNDAAECIADHCGKGVENFVALMNEKAQELGMTHTSFANPSGLDAQGHYSCALDMAKLAAYAMKDPTFARIVSTKEATVGTRTLSNHNKLLGTLSGCIGLKTGYTTAAGRTLVTCCERNGMRLVAVTLNDGADWNDHTALYEYGFSHYQNHSVVSRGEVCAVLPVRGGDETSVKIVAEKAFSYPLSELEQITTHLILPEELQAPFLEKDVVGEMSILLNGDEVGRISLSCANGVAAAQETRKPGLLQRLFGF